MNKKYPGFDALCGVKDPRPTLKEARAQAEAKPLPVGQAPTELWIDMQRFRELATSDEYTEGKKLYEARKKAEAEALEESKKHNDE